ncbi:hypothetical protein [Tunturiibacter lichenicola]|uniref:hypothetical protein n=1 Tax=Tunturiibacter lichenicola TaxID=2051959 RepID=UPI003D9BA0DC
MQSDKQMSMFGEDQPARSPGRRKKSQPPRDWADDTRSLLERHFRYDASVDVVVRELNLTLPAVASRIAETRRLSNLRIFRDFEQGGFQSSKYVPAFKHKSSAEMARAIANGLAKLAPEEPALFEHAIRFYAGSVEASHKIMLGVRDWTKHNAGEPCERIEGVRNIIRLVERLNIANLKVQYFGYLCDEKRPNLVRRLKELGAGRGTVEYIKPPNPKSKSNSDQLGIGIGSLAMRCGQEQFHSSYAFRIVMALALIRKIWLTPEEEILDFQEHR